VVALASFWAAMVVGPLAGSSSCWAALTKSFAISEVVQRSRNSKEVSANDSILFRRIGA